MHLRASLRKADDCFGGDADGGYDDETVELPRELLGHLGEPSSLRPRGGAAADYEEIYGGRAVATHTT
jgi:hypothetical protein